VQLERRAAVLLVVALDILEERSSPVSTHSSKRTTDSSPPDTSAVRTNPYSCSISLIE
jgi:hypothetical protein